MTQAHETVAWQEDRSCFEADQERISLAVAEAVASRAVIEQAKGMLCVIYDIDDQAAFDLLRWRSQTTNTKLRALAGQLIADFRSVNTSPQLPARSTYDDLLLTGHERVRSGPSGPLNDSARVAGH